VLELNSDRPDITRTEIGDQCFCSSSTTNWLPIYWHFIHHWLCQCLASNAEGGRHGGF